MVGHTERHTTPPRRTVDTSTLQVTPEHVRQIEINRLKAKAAQRQRESEASSSSIVNPNNKRCLTSTRPGQEPQSTSVASPLNRDSRLGTYFEYDLSKMINSKGGFLVNDGGNVDTDLKRKEKEREIQRNIHNLDLPMFLDSALNPKCKECHLQKVSE